MGGGRIPFQPMMNVGVPGKMVEGGDGVQPQHRYFRNNMRGGRRGGRTQGNGEPVIDGGGRGGGGRGGGGGWYRRPRNQRGQGKPSGGQEKGGQDKQSAEHTGGTSGHEDGEAYWGDKEPITQSGTKEVHNTTTQSQA